MHYIYIGHSAVLEYSETPGATNSEGIEEESKLFKSRGVDDEFSQDHVESKVPAGIRQRSYLTSEVKWRG